MIAIALNGNDINALIDDCFGKCEYFLIFNKKTNEYKYVINPAKKYLKKKGIRSASFLIKHGVSIVISGNFGIPVKRLFDKHKVQMVIVSDKLKKLKDISWIKQNIINS